MGRGERKDVGPPPIPLLNQGSRLSLTEFEDAYGSLEDLIIFQVMGDSNEPHGYAIGKINKFYPCEDTGAHVELSYLGCEDGFYRWYIEHEGEAGGLPKDYSHHLCRRALSTCIRKEGRKMIHVQKWAPVTREDAHTLLVAWGYTGFADKGRRAPLSRRSGHVSAPGSAAKSRPLKRTAPRDPSEEPEAIDCEKEGDDEPREEPRAPRRRTKGSAARAREASNALDSVLEDATKVGPDAHEKAGPLESRLAGLRARLQEKTGAKKGGAAQALADKAQAAAATSKPRKRRRSSDVVHALQKALLPRHRDREYDLPEDDSYSEGNEDDDGLPARSGSTSLVAKKRQLRKFAQENPGQLLRRGLENMRDQVGQLYGDQDVEEDKYSPVVNRYLLSVLLPNFPARQQPEERHREMRTLALGIDLLLKGKIDSAGDLFMQRFKSLTMALRDNDNRFGHYLELLPEDLVGGGASQDETEYARTMALKAARSEALLKKGCGAGQSSDLARTFSSCPTENAAKGAFEITGEEPEEDAGHQSTSREEDRPTAGSSCELRAGRQGRSKGSGAGGCDGQGSVGGASQGGREPQQVEGPSVCAPTKGPVRMLVDGNHDASGPGDAPGEFCGQGGRELSHSLGELFDLLLVAPHVSCNALAKQIMDFVETQHTLQLGISLLQLLLASLRDRGHLSGLTCLFEDITPLVQGTLKQGRETRQRDLLPLPLPPFGALLNLAKKLKRPGSGVLVWSDAEARKLGKQQRRKLVSAACEQTWRLLSVIVLNGESSSWVKLVPASDHVETQSQRVALAGLSRRCAWWSNRALQPRPETSFEDVIRSRQVDYTGDAVLKALPLRLEELAPGLPEDGVAGSLDALAIADGDVARWLRDPSQALLSPESWPRPVPTASMNVTPHEWERIVSVLFRKGILEPIDLSEVFRVDDQPILNGIFAVEKGGDPAPGEARVTRLIMNLVPTNSLQRLMPGDLATLSGSSNWSSILLGRGEVLLWSGDDQKGAFYAWRLPKVWRKLMAFKWPVPGHLVGRPSDDSVYVASAVIPMGWINAVSLFQHLHRRAGLAREPSGAGLDPSREWRRDKPIPKGAVEPAGAWYQYYLDDFDCPEKVPRNKWEIMAQTMSPTQARQRASYDRIGIGISVKKAHIREPCVTRMGAEIDGLGGFLSAPREKMLETGWLMIWSLSRPALSPRMMMVVLGRFTRCFEFRRPLMGLLNRCWPKSMWCRASRPSALQAHELITAGSLLGLAVMDMRTPVSGLVTCSDASTKGGGMCASAGLSSRGQKFLEQLDAIPFDTECFKPQGSLQQNPCGGPRVLVVSMFDGPSAAMCGLTRLPCAVQGYAMSATDVDELRLSRTRFPGVIQLGKPQEVTATVIEKLVASIGYRLDLVLFTAVSPCHCLGGVGDGTATSSTQQQLLFWEIPRVYELLKQSFAVPVHLLLENLADIPDSAIAAFNEALRLKPYLVDAKSFTWVRRPRLFWVTWGITPLPGEVLRDAGLYYEWQFPIQRPAKDFWVDPGCSWDAEEDTLLPVFTRIVSGSLPIAMRLLIWLHRLMVHFGNLDHRVMLLLDSQVVCGIISKGMRARYSRAVLAFLTYVADVGLQAERISQLCEAAASWVEFLYADGERKGLASDGLAGLQYFLPQCQSRLKLAWKYVKVWQRLEPPERVLPLSPLLVLGMAGLAAALHQPEIVAGLLVCFDGILRSGELYQLRVGDVTFYATRAALRLGLTKGGKRTGQEEMIVINSRIAVRWLRRACANKRDDQLVLHCGADFFRRCFKLLVSEFGLSDSNLNVYSLRRGGASWDFLAYQSMERTLLRGRWASTSSARVYVQDAVATVAHLKLRPWQTALAHRAAAFL
ncbi:unnamed protein product [Symbiodinium sp. CCMP2592]|nr:unnamed protein product [Symbiodinium sp. CCMP2592]